MWLIAALLCVASVSVDCCLALCVALPAVSHDLRSVNIDTPVFNWLAIQNGGRGSPWRPGWNMLGGILKRNVPDFEKVLDYVIPGAEDPQGFAEFIVFGNPHDYLWCKHFLVSHTR